MRIINEFEYQTKFPFDNEEYFNKLSSEQKKSYLMLISVYNEYMYKYLIKKLNLKFFDNILKNSNNHFIPINDEDMDIYQYFSKDYLSYFYVRNNIHIERLSHGEIQYLYDCFAKRKIDYNDEIEKFICNTLKKVLLDEPNVNNHKINYGPNNDRFYQETNSIILGVRYDEYTESFIGESEDEWELKHLARMKELNELVLKMNESYNNNVIQINIVKYDEYSIKLKNKK